MVAGGTHSERHIPFCGANTIGKVPADLVDLLWSGRRFVTSQDDDLFKHYESCSYSHSFTATMSMLALG